MKKLFNWTVAVPFLAWGLYFTGLVGDTGVWNLAGGFLLIAGVMAAVHHAEIVAHWVGEPFGTIILAISVTILEASIIVSLMLTGGAGVEVYARDTLFSAVMIILNGILGLSMLVGAIKFKEQIFQTQSVIIALVGLVSILVLTLVLPNFTSSIAGPVYSQPQLVLVSICCLVIYAAFLLTQTIRHRNYFLTESVEEEDKVISSKEAVTSLLLLLASLGAVVFLAKTLSPSIESGIENAGLPKALVGVIVAMVILLPEGIAAVKAAQKNKFQTSINLSLGSALASIGLSIPTVAALSVAFDLPLVLGIDAKAIIFLGLSVFTVMLSLNKGRTNGLFGTVLLVNLFAWIFTIIYS